MRFNVFSKFSFNSRSFLRWCLLTFAKLIVIACFTLFIYVIYLDGKVTHRFEGHKWQVPVQIFGYTPKFSINQTVNLQHFAHELKAMGYQKVARPTRHHQFSQSLHAIEINVPAFTFPTGFQPQHQIIIKEKNHKVAQLYVDNRQVDDVNIPPSLLARIVPDNREDRIVVGLQQVPELLLDMLIFVEDKNFYFHHGIAPLGILRALYANIKAGKRVQGGSTLTQQLVKNMFLTREKTITRKIKEALMSLILEYRYSKDQLLEAYVNEVYLGQQYANGVYGVGLASKFYFNQTVDQLSIAQMALLIAEIRGPSYYDPWRHPERARKRRDFILSQLFDAKKITKQQYLTALSSDLVQTTKHKPLAQRNPGYLQLVKRELSFLLPEISQQSGVRIFTGFSAYAQSQLEHSVANKLNVIEKQHHVKKLETAMLVTDIHSGQIRALVGGRNTKYAGFNRVLMAKRQIGSLIKPFIYVAALERYEQYNLATVLMDKPIVIKESTKVSWQPENYDGKFLQQVNLIDALVESRNVPTVNLGLSIGLEHITAALPMLGYGRPISSRPSMLLGAIDMAPIDINQLYLTLANQGKYITQHAIHSIVSKNTEILWQANEHSEQRLSENGAYLINYALSEVTRRGTAKSLTWRLPNAAVAGKTGTTNKLRDSWFVGFDSNVLVTTWVGRDDNKPAKVTGSSGALVLFADFMKNYGVENKKPQVPSSIEWLTFENETGNAVQNNCENSRVLPVVAGSISVLEQCAQPKEKDNKKRSWFERLFGK